MRWHRSIRFLVLAAALALAATPRTSAVGRLVGRVQSGSGLFAICRGGVLCYHMAGDIDHYEWAVLRAGQKRKLPGLGRAYRRFPHSSLELSPDGRHLAWLSGDDMLTVHDLVTDTTVRRYPNPRGFGGYLFWLSPTMVGTLNCGWWVHDTNYLSVFDITRRARVGRAVVTRATVEEHISFGGEGIALSLRVAENPPVAGDRLPVVVVYSRVVGRPRASVRVSVRLPAGRVFDDVCVRGERVGLLWTLRRTDAGRDGYTTEYWTTDMRGGGWHRLRMERIRGSTSRPEATMWPDGTRLLVRPDPQGTALYAVLVREL